MDIDNLLSNLKQAIVPTEAQIQDLTEKAKNLFLAEPSMLSLPAPITIVGDIHGQFYDLRELFRVASELPSCQFLFLGDFVDRGLHSIETFLYLVCLKIKYPTRIFMLRGNHESRQITQVYGFYDEILRKFGSISVWKACIDVFDSLPLAAVIKNEIFCVHGGLSPTLTKISELNDIPRGSEVPHDGIVSDLLWSDPFEGSEQMGFQQSQRGAGYFFGADVCEKFCKENNVAFVCRSHQLAMDGYKWQYGGRLCTVWSAPNYCYRAGNVASILEVNEFGERNFKIFDAAVSGQQGKADKRVIPDYFL
ncbi:Serine/threonine-protein phosphatase [Spironucleus salmonicida]|uniref:Serine/threonine-protein phosphatase n=1 Tax=Spironucleus salmonicida TaxID=348837 RepID=V6LL69_9EUKA|nr:Serine/threonine-protein phosphatase [Spironucleus salmonicida]|eukprot:EST44486.1 Serine/threonine-protein phosphatase [Spironucleus salmonicida]